MLNIRCDCRGKKTIKLVAWATWDRQLKHRQGFYLVECCANDNCGRVTDTNQPFGIYHI